MSEIMESNYRQMKTYIERNGFLLAEKEAQGYRRMDVQHGVAKCTVKLYSTGAIELQGASTNLNNSLIEAKEAVENEEDIRELLPFEIGRFPEVLRENIPDIDPIIVRFIEEAIVTLKAGSNLSCAFLLGGASEKSVLLLVDTYAKAIGDEMKYNRFVSRTSGKFISTVFDEFKHSWQSSTNKPQGCGWTNDLEIKIENIFQFCRICRNEAGHPHLPTSLDKGVLVANMRQFVRYVEDLYELIRYYQANPAEV
ncbi:MAG: hypothetical protein WBG92_19025 [Thiohalocapsa sp.]